jgi:hypothetical protein
MCDACFVRGSSCVYVCVCVCLCARVNAVSLFLSFSLSVCLSVCLCVCVSMCTNEAPSQIKRTDTHGVEGLGFSVEGDERTDLSLDIYLSTSLSRARALSIYIHIPLCIYISRRYNQVAPNLRPLKLRNSNTRALTLKACKFKASN